MLYLSKRVNTLKQRVEEENLERRKTIWKEPDNHTLDDFPLLDEEDLRNITCGVYQLKLSTSYIQEHLEGNCQILIHKEDEHLIRVKLQGCPLGKLITRKSTNRGSSSQKYAKDCYLLQQFISVDPSSIDEVFRKDEPKSVSEPNILPLNCHLIELRTTLHMTIDRLNEVEKILF